VSQRTTPILVLCGVAFAAGALFGGRYSPPGERHVERFAAAWDRGDYAAMYGELSDADRARVTRARFARLYRDTMDVATALAVNTGRPRRTGAAYGVPVSVSTRVFGTVAGVMRIGADNTGVQWSRALLFPGLAAGQSLRRDTRLPTRATRWPATSRSWRRATRTLVVPDRRRRRRPAGADPATGAPSSSASAFPPTPRSA
jgi:hypothetical protein